MESKKRVGIGLEARCYRVAKQYSARFDTTMAEVGEQAIKHWILNHSRSSNAVASILEHEMVGKDPRAEKPCWGHLCLTCIERSPCTTGCYGGTFVHDEERFGPWDQTHNGPRPVFGADPLLRSVEYLEREKDNLEEIIEGMKRGDCEAVIEAHRQCEDIAFCELDPSQGRFTYISPAFMRVWGIDASVPTEKLGPWLVSPDKQPCGTSSETLAKRRIADAMESKFKTFDWMHCCIDKKTLIPCEITLISWKDRMYGFLTRLDD